MFEHRARRTIASSAVVAVGLGLLMAGGVSPAASAGAALVDATRTPPKPPKLPNNFRGKGTYIVKDMRLNVGFKWRARKGDVQMTAGSKSDPIYFTNLIYDDSLYTLTHKWPGLSKKERGVCVKLSDNFNLDFFNWWLGQSFYVGKEILLGKQRRKVNHFRGVVVVPALPPGNYDRAPLISADFYVDSDDSATFWQVLHFGVHNKFDPALDEWFEMDSFKKKAGKVELPDKCKKIGIGDADDGNWFPELDLNQ